MDFIVDVVKIAVGVGLGALLVIAGDSAWVAIKRHRANTNPNRRFRT